MGDGERMPTYADIGWSTPPRSMEPTKMTWSVLLLSQGVMTATATTSELPPPSPTVSIIAHARRMRAAHMENLRRIRTRIRMAGRKNERFLRKELHEALEALQRVEAHLAELNATGAV